MPSHEVRFAEAITSLTARLEAWGVEEARDKAHGFVTDMVRHGWRPSAPKVYELPSRPEVGAPPTPEYVEMRARTLKPAPKPEPDPEESA